MRTSGKRLLQLKVDRDTGMNKKPQLQTHTDFRTEYCKSGIQHKTKFWLFEHQLVQTYIFQDKIINLVHRTCVFQSPLACWAILLVYKFSPISNFCLKTNLWLTTVSKSLTFPLWDISESLPRQYLCKFNKFNKVSFLRSTDFTNGLFFVEAS